MYKEIIKQIRPEMEKTEGFFEAEMAKIKTGRATPSLIEDIVVDCFGQKFVLKQLAAISISNSNQLDIQPWDSSYIEAIEKAIEAAGMGLSKSVDKDVIRVSLPKMSEEYRKGLVKVISEKQEETRKTMRRWREKAWQEIQEGFQKGQVREDDKFRAKEELQELIDEFGKKIDEMGERKKKEIME